jgi:3-isopropylmalate dehydrogenase
MKKIITILAGDGIGQEVMPPAVNVLNTIAKKFQHIFTFQEGDIGGTAYEKHGAHFPAETEALCQTADAVLFGSVGGPVHESHLDKWKNCEKNSILALRKALQLNCNLRPIHAYPCLSSISPLKENIFSAGVDILIVRELLGDIYFGEHKQWVQDGKRHASDVAEYNEQQIRTVAHQSFQFAQKRRKKLTSVDKANVLETSQLWRMVLSEMAPQYPDVKLEHMLVDNCAMQLFINPAQFDVIVTSNLFGDILSDAAAALPGSLGLTPSASLNELGGGLYEPSGGSAPDIAGKNIANPIAQILSAAMMLRHSFGLQDEAHAIDKAIEKTLAAGFRTQDIYTEGFKLVSTQEMGNRIINNI